MKYYYIAFLILTFNAIQASIYASLKENIQSHLHRKADQTEDEEANNNYQGTDSMASAHFSYKIPNYVKDNKLARSKANILKTARTHEKNLNNGRDLPWSKRMDNKQIGKERYHMDAVLNELRRRSFRRKGSDSDSSGESSSLELKNWLEEWDEHWMQKKFEAVNSSQHRGDVVNMVAARPWGVSCGDPNQHDLPWGTCTLPAECDAEYRIYRGDYFCGRSAFVCCALQLTNYDMYQGLDISFDDSSFATDSNEKHRKGKDSKKKKKKDRNERKKARDKRKKKIKKTIKQIEKEIKKILSRAFRNGTTQRKKKTRELKKFIEMLKKQFKKDRKSVVSVHEYEIEKIDERLQNKLDQIAGVNEQFLSNDTFRDIVVNGTVNKEKVRMLLRTFPELKKIIFGGRRTGSNTLGINEEENEDLLKQENKEDLKFLEYDIELGQLYY